MNSSSQTSPRLFFSLFFCAGQLYPQMYNQYPHTFAVLFGVSHIHLLYSFQFSRQLYLEMYQYPHAHHNKLQITTPANRSSSGIVSLHGKPILIRCHYIKAHSCRESPILPSALYRALDKHHFCRVSAAIHSVKKGHAEEITFTKGRHSAKLKKAHEKNKAVSKPYHVTGTH